MPTVDLSDAALTRYLELDAQRTPGELTVGRIPEEEEPDTCILGKNGVFFVRVVGLPNQPAEPEALHLARSASLAAPLAREVQRLRAVLARAQEDIDWMLNNRQFLNADTFDYLEKP